MDIGVCYLRLDFESFDIQGLSDSKENSDAADQTGTVTECQDKFTVAVCRYEDICSSHLYGLLYYVSIFYRFFYFDAFQAAASPTIPTICGSNQGQHGNNCNKNIVYNISRIEQTIMIRSYIFFQKFTCSLY